jgi:hypothetical protein
VKPLAKMLKDRAVSNFGGPITVTLPIPIVSNPAGNQTITQPPGTAFSVNNLKVTGTVEGVTTSGFADTPVQCGTGYYALGILANGDATCQAIVHSGVTSFNGRNGDVTPQAGDYSWSMLSGKPTLYNQNLYWNNILQTAQYNLDFSPAFQVNQETSPISANIIDLADVAVPGTYINVTTITVDAYGRITSVIANGPCSGWPTENCNYSGGIITETGTWYKGGNVNNCANDPNGTNDGWNVCFTPAFPTALTSFTMTNTSDSQVIPLCSSQPLFITICIGSSFQSGAPGAVAVVGVWYFDPQNLHGTWTATGY